MRDLRKSFSYVIFIFSALIISGCATPSAYKQIIKEASSQHNSQIFSCSSDRLYSLLTKVLLSRKFMIEKENRNTKDITAKRYFQKGKRTIIVILQAKIVEDSADSATLFLNGIETTERLYVADRTRFFLFLIPLPGGGGKEAARIKEGERIIEDRAFYNEFFKAIEDEIQDKNSDSTGYSVDEPPGNPAGIEESKEKVLTDTE